jgi:hypothetical protein
MSELTGWCRWTSCGSDQSQQLMSSLQHRKAGSCAAQLQRHAARALAAAVAAALAVKAAAAVVARKLQLIMSCDFSTPVD